MRSSRRAITSPKTTTAPRRRRSLQPSRVGPPLTRRLRVLSLTNPVVSTLPANPRCHHASMSRSTARLHWLQRVRARLSSNFGTKITRWHAGVVLTPSTPRMRMCPTTLSRGDSAATAAGSTFPREEADMLALELVLVTIEDRHHHCQAHQRMDITEADERQMTEWRCLSLQEMC
jgi:hypothetical protein